MTTFYSIDPGVGGAICRWYDGAPVCVTDINLDRLDLLSVTLSHDPGSTVVLERTHAMPPPTGSVGNFRQGEVRGILLMACAVHGHTVINAEPRTWKGDLGLWGEDKEASRQMALEIYPHAADWLQRKKDHDRAEAILIGHWWKGQR